VDAGLLKALAVTGAKRSPLMPNVPTVAEAGVPGYEGGFSLVMLMPAGAPQDVVDLISKTVMAAVRDKTVVDKLQAQGYEPVGNTPAEYAVQLNDEIEQNAEIIKSLREAGVTP
jgi:tripartite-type tricarboxylate transporter receptor subunit TctC